MYEKLKFTGKMEKNKAKRTQVSLKIVLKVKDPVFRPTNLRNVQLANFFSALFLLLVGSGPKRSMPIEKLGSFLLVSSMFQREGKLHCVKR